MPAEVRVSYNWTHVEIRRLMRCYPRPFLVWGDWKSCGLIVVLGVIVVFAIRQVWLSEDIGHRDIVTLVLALPYLAACALLVRTGFLRSSFAGSGGNPDLNHPIRYSITQDRWVCETHSFRSETRWRSHMVVLRKDEGFLSLTHDHQVAWLPIHGFESEAAIETFVEMVKTHGMKYEDRRQAG